MSNGEILPPPLSPVVREAIRRTLDDAERNARLLGMSRRQFLSTLCGAATAFVALAACSKEESKARDVSPGGTFDVPTTATTSPDTARDVLGGDEFIFDVQTHLLDWDLSESGTVGAGFAQGFPYASCGEDDWRACFGIDHWFEELFLRSDTTMAVISAVPILETPNPLSIEAMERGRALTRELCGDERVFLHGQVNPNVGDLAASLDGMERLVAEHPIAAWKVYTHVPGARGWWLDDHEADAVQCGRAFLDKVSEIGPRIVCVHKGFGSGSRYSAPVDIGPVAKAYPDVNFVVYHSGYDVQNEGPYTLETADAGVNRLLASLESAGIGPGGNVYAELGSTWFYAMRDPTQAAHILGKLLKQVGPDRVVWGTDSIWYGTPQDQIQAMRTFQISEEFQDRFGYPALTDEIKRKIFGVNSATLYGADPITARCDASAEDVEQYRAALGPPRTYGPESIAEARAVMAAHGISHPV